MPRYVITVPRLRPDMAESIQRYVEDRPLGPWVLPEGATLQDLDSPRTIAMPTAELNEGGGPHVLREMAWFAGGAIAGIIATLLVVSGSL